MGDLFEISLPDTVRLPAISLWQPWASLMFAFKNGVRVKPDETRDWPFPERLAGQDVVIQAAKHPVSRDDLEDDEPLGELCAELFGPGWRKGLPFGAFLGTVRFVFARSMIITQPLHDLDELCGYWTPGRYAWRTTDPKPFAVPIPSKGQQGFWTVELPSHLLRPHFHCSNSPEHAQANAAGTHCATCGAPWVECSPAVCP